MRNIDFPLPTEFQHGLEESEFNVFQDDKMMETVLIELSGALSRHFSLSALSYLFKPAVRRDRGRLNRWWTKNYQRIADFITEKGWQVQAFAPANEIPSLLIELPEKEEQR